MARIKGNKKNNKLKGKGQSDKIKALAGDDELLGNGGNDKLLGGTGNDKLFGGDGDDKLNGGSGNDILDGGAGDDTMDGGDGDDFMEAGEGADFFIGGAGIDTVSYAKSAFGISVEMLLQTTTQGGLNDGFSGIENIDGSQFGDTIEGDGAANKLRGLDGKDYLKGGNGNDILDGGNGDDQIYSDNGADRLIGGAGYDSLVYEKAGSGASINLATGVGGGSAAGDTFSGFERVFGTKFGDTITGTDGAAEALFGEGGDDDLFGKGGNDTLFGGAGRDDLYGGEGNDRLSPEGNVAEADHLFGGGGIDWADYSNAGAAVTVSLSDNYSAGRAAGDTYNSIENVQGSNYGDMLVPNVNGRAYGGGGDDFLFDTTGTELLRGGSGADRLNDNLFGAEDGHRDIFVLEVGLGIDTIVGFTQSPDAIGDRFWLLKEQFGALSLNPDGTIAAGQIYNTTNDKAYDASDRLIFDTDPNDRVLYYDPDGTGSKAPVEIAELLGVSSIQYYDFVVVPNL